MSQQPIVSSGQLAKLVIAAAAGVCLFFGLDWEPITTAWRDEALLGVALFLALCVFILP